MDGIVEIEGKLRVRELVSVQCRAFQSSGFVLGHDVSHATVSAVCPQVTVVADPATELRPNEGNFLGAVDRALDELDLFVGLSERVAEKL